MHERRTSSSILLLDSSVPPRARAGMHRYATSRNDPASLCVRCCHSWVTVSGRKNPTYVRACMLWRITLASIVTAVIATVVCNHPAAPVSGTQGTSTAVNTVVHAGYDDITSRLDGIMSLAPIRVHSCALRFTATSETALCHPVPPTSLPVVASSYGAYRYDIGAPSGQGKTHQP